MSSGPSIRDAPLLKPRSASVGIVSHQVDVPAPGHPSPQACDGGRSAEEAHRLTRTNDEVLRLAAGPIDPDHELVRARRNRDSHAGAVGDPAYLLAIDENAV